VSVAAEKTSQESRSYRNYDYISTSYCDMCRVRTSVVNIVATGRKVCGRCDEEHYLIVGELEKNRWMRTGRR